jgi:hypothetical protein
VLAARQAYQVPETGVRLKPSQKLTDAYLETNLPVVRQRLYVAGVRLAWVLNESTAAASTDSIDASRAVYRYVLGGFRLEPLEVVGPVA